MTSNFIDYLRSIVPCPCRVTMIEGYKYMIISAISILYEQCQEGFIANKVTKRLLKNKKIRDVDGWYRLNDYERCCYVTFNKNTQQRIKKAVYNTNKK